MTGDSRSDLEALRRSRSGKVFALGVLLIATLSAAAWIFFIRAEGIGAPERADKVIVVRGGDMAGYHAVLGRDGFDAAEGTLAQWVDKARDQLPDPPEGTDVQVVLTLADHFGYGYIVFEHPQDVDFSGLEIDPMPAFEEHVRFAVLSVGDFAFPHRMTVNPEPSKALRRVEISLLQALFAQEVLAEALPDNASASVEAIQLRSKLEGALLDLQLVERVEALANETTSEVGRVLRDERAKVRPVRLGGENEGGEGVPDPAGGVVTLVRRFDIISEDGIQAEPEWSSQQLFHATDATDQGRLPLCNPVLSAMLEEGPPVRLVASPDGASLLLERRGRPQELWVSTPSAPCGYVRASPLPLSKLEEVASTVPGRTFVARVGTVHGEATFEFVHALEGTVSRAELTGVAVRDAAWLDERHMAATGDDGWVYLIDAAGDSRPLALLPTELGRDPSLFEVARLSDDSLLLTVGSDPRRLVRVQASMSWSALFATPPAIPEPQDEALPSVAPLRLEPDAFTSTALTTAGIASEPVGSPDGASVAFTILDRGLDDPGLGGDAEIALVGAGGGDLRLLTKNAVLDRSPSFMADGSAVLFQTQVSLPHSSWRVVVPRSVRLDGTK